MTISSWFCFPDFGVTSIQGLLPKAFEVYPVDSISIVVVHHHQKPDTATLRIQGFLYANTLDQLEKTLQSVLSADRKKLVLDLSETNYISSGGWVLILTSFRRIQADGGGLVLTGMKAEVYDSFELLEFDKILKSYPNVETALKEGFAGTTTQAKNRF